MKTYTEQSAAMLPPAKLSKAIYDAGVISSQICKEFIDCGRGFEKPSETLLKDDELAMRWKANAEQSRILICEERARRVYSGSLKRIPVKTY